MANLLPYEYNLVQTLLKDLRGHLSSFSRADYDRIHKQVRSGDLHTLYDLRKQFDTSLLAQHMPKEPVTGRLVTNAVEIRALRQTYGFFSRLEGNVSKESVEAQLSDYAVRIQTDDSWISDSRLLHLARRYVKRTLGRVPDFEALRPKHGPGAVSTGEKGAGKLYFSQTHPSLDDIMGGDSEPFFRLPNQPPRILSRVDPVAKTTVVPKDFKRVRVISCEPLAMQFVQQGIMGHLMRRLERANSCCKLYDQSVNALKSRDFSKWATLDLSNASDGVSSRLVGQLLPLDWFEFLNACRSTHTVLPDGRVIPIKAFAPMGNAFCFPLESLVFAAISVAAIQIHGYLSEEDAVQRCQVFGDDLIVPLHLGTLVAEELEKIGFTVNRGKSCLSDVTLFRESCGAEWWYGEDVTVVRPKTLNQNTASDTLGILPMVGYANRLESIGFRHTAQALADTVTLPVALGFGDPFASPTLRWRTLARTRWHSGYQRSQSLIAMVKSRGKLSLSSVEEWEALYAYFSSGWSAQDTKFGIKTRVALGWVPSPSLRINH